MNNVAFVGVLVALLCVSTVHANLSGEVWVNKKTCDGTPDVKETVQSGVCVDKSVPFNGNTMDVSLKVTCESASATSKWSAVVAMGKGCATPIATVNGVGTACTLGQLMVMSGAFKIDCSGGTPAVTTAPTAAATTAPVVTKTPVVVTTAPTAAATAAPVVTKAPVVVTTAPTAAATAAPVTTAPTAAATAAPVVTKAPVVITTAPTAAATAAPVTVVTAAPVVATTAPTAAATTAPLATNAPVVVVTTAPVATDAPAAAATTAPVATPAPATGTQIIGKNGKPVYIAKVLMPSTCECAQLDTPACAQTCPGETPVFLDEEEDFLKETGMLRFN